MKNIGLTIALGIVAWMALSPALPSIEGRFAPVTRDTVVRRVIDPAEKVGGGWSVIEGVSTKVRDCDFLALEWYLGSRSSGGVRAQYRFLEEAAERGPTPFKFGPWAVQLTADQLKTGAYAIAVHSCHPVWNTRTLFWESAGD